MFYSNQQAFLLENVPCNNVSCKSVRRMFKVFWELSDLNQIKDAVVATFFDIYEDVSSTLYYSKQHLSFCIAVSLCVPLADCFVEMLALQHVAGRAFSLGNSLLRCSLEGEQTAAAHCCQDFAGPPYAPFELPASMARSKPWTTCIVLVTCGWSTLS